MGSIDVERDGRWIHILAVVADPEPDVGYARPHVLDVVAHDDDGVLVPLPTDEVRELQGQFERAYYRWRGRGLHKA